MIKAMRALTRYAVFSELSEEELQGFEVALKKVGKRAAAMIEQR
jgi:hypothetical protein